MRLLALSTFLLLFLSNSFSQNADIKLLRDINLNRNKSLDPTFKFITHSITPVSIGVPAIVLSIGLIQKDSTIKNKGLYIAGATIMSGVLSSAMKLSIKRERPFKTYPDIEKETSGGSYSFPSGHTSSAFATATAFSLAFPKWYVVVPSYAWAGALGYSRMHLGVHYPSDVAAGAIIGAGSSFLSYKINKWLSKKKRIIKK